MSLTNQSIRVETTEISTTGTPPTAAAAVAICTATTASRLTLKDELKHRTVFMSEQGWYSCPVQSYTSDNLSYTVRLKQRTSLPFFLFPFILAVYMCVLPDSKGTF